MSGVSEETVVIRQIQGVAALLTCLPSNGKCRELFTLALGAAGRERLDEVGPPEDPDSDEGMKSWLERLWGPDGISAEEQRVADWQADSDNMAAAIGEFQALAGKLRAAA